MTDQVISSFTGEHAFLSSFYRAPFVYLGILWPTAEHAFQAMKHPDPHDWPAFASLATPQQAKKQGRKPPLLSNWGDVRRRVMLEVVLAKFGRNGELRYRLAQTAPAVLVEGNTWGDKYWGAVKLLPRSTNWVPGEPFWDPGIPDSTLRLVGHNWLGRCLMMAREVLS